MFNLTSFGLGFVAGFGTGFVSREIVNASKDALKPLAKEVMRSGMQIIEKSRETFAHVGEALEDLFAEVRSESQEAEKSREKDLKTRRIKQKTSVAAEAAAAKA